MKNTLLLIITVATVTFGGLHLSNWVKVSNLHEIYLQSYELCNQAKNNTYPALICKYGEVINKIRDENRVTSGTIFTTTGELIDLKKGETINLDLSGLSKHELNVYLTKNTYEIAKENLRKDKNLKYTIYLLYVLIPYLIIFYLIPFFWYFFLQRVKEVADVIKK